MTRKEETRQAVSDITTEKEIMPMATNGDTKMLLLRDLAARLPYGVKVSIDT